MTCEIEKIVHGGYGLTRDGGFTVLVPYGVPGDLVDAVFDRENPSFGWIRRVVRPSPHRRDSSCPVFGVCGGCIFDMMTYAREIEAKREILLEDMDRIGGLRDVRLDRVVPSASEYGYRNNAQLKVDGEGRMGYFMRKSHQVVPLPERGCLLLTDALNGFLDELRRTVRLVRGGVRLRSNARGAVACRGVPGRENDTSIVYSAGGLSFRVGIDAFFQVNDYAVEPWLALIVEYLEPGEADHVLDLYCGAGLISLAAARRCRTVTGIEMSGSAVRDARFNARVNGIENAEFRRADAAAGVPVKCRSDKVIVDPPRAGLTPALVKSLAEMRPRRLVYASCNTATFSRDAARLTARGLVLRALSFVDMFPRTSHMEVVALFVPSESA